MDRAADLLQQIETRFIELTWMWQEVRQLAQQQEQTMKKVELEITGQATMRDAEGRLMSSFPLGGVYKDIGYDAAVKIQDSFNQAHYEHMQRLIQMGYARAEALATADAKAKK